MKNHEIYVSGNELIYAFQAAVFLGSIKITGFKKDVATGQFLIYVQCFLPTTLFYFGCILTNRTKI